MLSFYDYAKSAQMTVLLEQVKLVRKTIHAGVRAMNLSEQESVSEVLAALARMQFVIEASQLDEV